MQTEKERVTEIVKQLPDDASFDEILRELAFERMINRGLADSKAGRVTAHDEVKRRYRRSDK